MKKTITFQLVIIVCAVIFAAIPLTSCGTKTFKIDNTTRIELSDGTTGNTVEITEPDIIQTLVQPFNDNVFKKGESTKNQAGWSYRLNFFQDDRLTASIVVHGRDGNRISFNNSFYDMIDGVINTDAYNELLSVRGQSGDYRPMVYVQDALYGETADAINTLPEEAVFIGTIGSIVPRNEPMVRENFTSNLLPIGSQVFCDEADLTIVYVLLPLNSKAQYSVYEAIE